MNEESFLLKNFQDYYSRHKIEAPAIEQREFGIGSFGKKISNRHISFHSSSELNSFLQKQIPLYISYSLAYYDFPDRTPMDQKGFQGADIVYEFDADDLKTECKQRHDSWECPKCKEQGKGAIDYCTKCGSPVKKEQWFCPDCLGRAKEQVFRLLDFIENDFAIKENVSVNFSGNAGYHIHLRGEKIRHLSQEARVELLDYLTAKDIDISKQGFSESGKQFLCPLPKEASGWGKIILDSIVEMIEKESPERIAALGGITFAKAKDLLSDRALVLKSIREKGILFSIQGRRNKDFWESLLKHVVSAKALDIDRQTSIDIRKIIRVPETLHGGTGLLAKTIPIGELREFNPFDDAIVFQEQSVRVFIDSAPKFYLKGQFFGPFKQEETELPLFAAIYLVARDSARLA